MENSQVNKLLEVALRIREMREIAGYTPEDVRSGNIADLRLRMKNMDIDAFCNEHNVGKITVNDIADALLKP